MFRGDYEDVKRRYDTLKVFQVKLGSLVWASIKVDGSHADARDMLVSLFVIISLARQGRNHIALMKKCLRFSNFVRYISI